MKKIVAVILCICLFISGCSREKNVDQDTMDKNLKTEEEGELREEIPDLENEVENDDIARDENQPNKMQNLSLNKEWATVTLAGISQPDFIMPTFEPKVDPYVIKKDLSNIENIDQFSGFTKDQKEMLAKNGFIVLPSSDTKMHYVYDANEYLGVPNFITSDSVLHLYHQFYDRSLMHIESSYLYEYLDHLTRQMLDKSIQLLDFIEDDDLIKLQERNIVYFLVARMLMLNSPDLDVEIRDDLYKLAKEEYMLIDKAEGFLRSPYLDYDFDYSQFTIRGHYSRSEDLGRFFKIMMWLGTVGFPFTDSEGNIEIDNIHQALLMTYTTFLDTDFISDAKLWNNIYQVTKQYVGTSDDINVFMMNGLRLEVFGENEDPNIFNNKEYYDKLIQAVSALPEPKIQGKFITVSTPSQKQFRYMGQRYIFDSFIMQNLVEPILRPLPSALDTMGILGSELAEDLLFNHYKPQEVWPEYEEIYKDLKEEVSNYGVDIWGQNLYNGWLWSIKESLTEYGKDSGMPYFMINDAWKAKSLNAALGSYTELKHDTVLYGKQSVAEMGGGIDYGVDYHYVEPNVYLYSKLLYLTEYTMSVLKERDMLDNDLESGAKIYQELLHLLIECSIKELRNERLTEEEYDALLYYGAKMEGISNTFLYPLIRKNQEYGSMQISDMLVTDIATSPGEYLTLGTGYFDNIYVVVPIEGKLYLSRGAVYSTYEFISGTRLTDEEWWELNGITLVKEKYGDYPVFSEPSENLPKQPDWIKSFKSHENNVSIKQIEVDWGLLVE